MKRHTVITFLALALLMAGTAQAQNWLGISYSTAAPVGKLSDYVSKYSWRGMSLDYKAQLKHHLLVGLSTAINAFDEKKDKASYTVETITATGVQYRHSTACPILATVAYSGNCFKGARWYAGIGLGTTYLYRSTDFGNFTFTRDSWQFLLSPEVGLQYPIIDDNFIYLSARYNQNFKNNDLDAQPYFAISLGWCWQWGAPKD